MHKTARRTLRLLILSLLALAGTFLFPAGAGAAASSWAEGDQASLRLISAADGVGSEPAVTLGLQVKLKPTWKIYWRSPGDAGLPPDIDWSGSRNFDSAEFRWPVPHRFTLFGLDTFGYEGEVVLPLTVRLARPGEAVDLQAHVRYLVCDPQICVPAEARLSLALPDGPAAPSEEAGLIQRFGEEVPGDGREDGLRLGTVAARTGDRTGLIVEVEADPPFAKPDVIVEGPASLRFAAPVVSLSDGGRRARFEIAAKAVEKGAPELAGLPLTLTVYDGKRALEAAVRPQGAPSAPALLPILALALLGGFILNFMPCVLPVLAIKLLGVVGQGGRERAAIRLSFLASAAGILFSFLVLAAGLIGLKSAGAAIGWGIQFQQPIFLAALALILVLFAANLFGLFQVPLPAWLGGLAAATGEQGREHGHSLAGAFAAGAFATLLATPCSAPFLGTAVGFALARGAPEILMIFTALGAGLAAPWLLIAAFPGLAQALPRPGRWMVWLKAVLGVALLAAAVWLISILDLQVGRMAAIAVALLLTAVMLALALRSALPGRWRGAAPAIVAVLALAALVVPALVPVVAAAPEAEAATDAGPWRPFAEADIAALVAEGKTVFVDVTADWCLTCQVNKRLVLNSEEIRPLLEHPRRVAMRADWTRPDPAIAAYLANFGRYGIPFNAVYGPKAPGGIVLPEVLTQEAVRNALDKAGG